MEIIKENAHNVVIINGFVQRFLAKNGSYLDQWRKPKMNKFHSIELKLVIKCMIFLGLEVVNNRVYRNILTELCYRKYKKVDPELIVASDLCA